EPSADTLRDSEGLWQGELPDRLLDLRVQTVSDGLNGVATEIEYAVDRRQLICTDLCRNRLHFCPGGSFGHVPIGTRWSLRRSRHGSRIGIPAQKPALDGINRRDHQSGRCCPEEQEIVLP